MAGLRQRRAPGKATDRGFARLRVRRADALDPWLSSTAGMSAFVIKLAGIVDFDIKNEGCYAKTKG